MDDIRREVATAQLDAYIDLLCHWRGRYEDDDRPVTLWWASAVCHHNVNNKLCGVLYVKGPFGDTTEQGIGFARIDGKTVLRSRCGALQAIQERGERVTRKQFREAAQKSGVSLPTFHATLYLKEIRMKQVTTERGFQLIEHEHAYGGPTTGARLVQQSSAVGHYQNSLDKPGSSFLWVGEHHHLDREQVAELVQMLQSWLQTGQLFPPVEAMPAA